MGQVLLVDAYGKGGGFGGDLDDRIGDLAVELVAGSGADDVKPIADQVESFWIHGRRIIT